MNSKISFASDIPQTSQEWFSWLQNEERKTVDAYLTKPSLLISAYRGEKEITRDYEGRELLELLQNANDQAAEVGKRGRVHIELTEKGLIVANTGKPFTKGGVESLQTSHLSPKRRKKLNLIGNKGLGFRSVLNWTRTPIIFSGSLRLAYTIDHARNQLRALVNRSDELASLVAEEIESESDLILPILAFPFYSEGGEVASAALDESAKEFLRQCQALMEGDFDTVIGMPFDAQDSHQAAMAQLNELRPEILLFTQNLAEIRICIGGEPLKTWKLEAVPSSPEVQVMCNEEVLGSWLLHCTGDVLPKEALDVDRPSDNQYEIIVAVPKAGGRPTPLFSYFPTEVIVPLPIACHATLELEQNRKHVRQGRRSNDFVLNQLAQFLARIAEETAQEVRNPPWLGCSLVMPLGEFPNDLIRVGFDRQLLSAAQSRAIVPTLGGPCVCAASARLISGADLSWLPNSVFADAALIGKKTDEEFLKVLGVPSLEPQEMKQRIVEHSDLTLNQRVALICGMLQNGVSSEACTSAVFIDTNHNVVGDGARVFIAPEGREIPNMPIWMELRFLSKAMQMDLSERMKISEARELQRRLAKFGLQEYSFGSVISALASTAAETVESKPEIAELVWQELVLIVFKLYRLEGVSSKKPNFPAGVDLKLRTQKGTLETARSLYFGRGFGYKGEIVQSLYQGCAIEKLVDSSSAFNFSDDSEELKGFLKWVGVAVWPRNKVLAWGSQEYVNFILREIRYPAAFGEYIVREPSAASDAYAEDVASIDGLEEILQTADSTAIAAWLFLDNRISEWRIPSADHATLCARPEGVRRGRSYSGKIHGFAAWTIETHAWLRSVDGARLKPKDCVLGERVLDSLFPRPAMPEAPDLDRFGIKQVDIVEGWRRAGVLTSLASLERDQIYAQLLELPSRSPDGALARPLYHWLLDASDSALGDGDVNSKEFFAGGKMWGRFGAQTAYFPVSELHHADTEGLPEVLLTRMKIVELRKRAGAEKVEKLFGVKSIERSGITQRVISFLSAPGSYEENLRFQEAKPFLYQLRASQSGQTPRVQAFVDLSLELSSELRAELIYNDERIEYDVPVWGWLIQDQILYVRTDPADVLEPSADMLADAISEALASIFRVGDGGEFARILRCKGKDRLQLLRKLGGECSVQDIESLRLQFAKFKGGLLAPANYPVGVLSPPNPKQEEGQLEIRPIPSPPEPIAPVAPDPVPKPLLPLQVVELVHVPTPPPVRQRLIIRPVAPGPRSITKYVTDGAFCEQKAMEFEESDAPQRYPLLVAPAIGSEGAGCDILSFSTEADRTTFMEATERDLALVARFIEVKGRGNPSAVIELKGNELAAAERHRSRYYLYRLFETDEGGYILTILNDPLGHKEALRPIVEIGMERSSATRCFALSSGMQPPFSP